MCRTNPTRTSGAASVAAIFGGLAAVAVTGGPAHAQFEGVLEEITVTAQRREERLEDVPISVTALSGDRFNSIFEAGEDIRALATRIPSLYAESSNGRLAPRFYIRGLGNTDFDLAASQPVLVVFDEVVQENVILKSYPLFDIERVEVLRGPQGTLFGRNTPAGIVKFDTRKPTDEFSGYAAATAGEAGTLNFEAAIGGGLNRSGTLMGRLSVLRQERDDWIDNGFTGESDFTGGFEELAWRGQLLWEPTDRISALFNVHGRDLEGTSSIFRANILTTGSNELNQNFDRDVVYFDEGNGNPQEADATGGSLRLDFDLASDLTLTSITAFETVENFSLGDIDGGVVDFSGTADVPPGITFDPDAVVFGVPGVLTFPGTITVPSQTQDGLDNLDQFTQEFRLASQATDRLFWQAGAFFFDSEFDVTTVVFFAPSTTLRHSNQAWAVFGQMSYDLTGSLNLTAGLRYTDDEKDLEAIAAPLAGPVPPVNVSDDNLSGDISLLYTVNEDLNLYGRLATGFRAPTIQGRDVAFGAPPSTADSETITSIEGGFKANLAENRVRLNGSVFYYTVDDQQLTAVGGTGNFIQLVNAEETTGYGFDLDSEFLITDNFFASVGLSYNNTEISDANLRVGTCGSGLCTPTDPIDNDGFALVDGNPLPQAPEWLASIYGRYSVPLRNGELYFAADYAYQSEVNFFLYESAEFNSGDTFELGVRAAYLSADGRWEFAVFGRNITDEENLKGAIDFSNNSAFVNDRRIWGATVQLNFGEIL